MPLQVSHHLHRPVPHAAFWPTLRYPGSRVTRRAASGRENSWIVRSGWGARSEGVWVTDSWRRLEALAVEAEQAKQKWVLSKYVARPG